MRERFSWVFLSLLSMLMLNGCGAQVLSFTSLDQNIQLRNFPFQTRQSSILVFTNAQEIDNLLPQLIPPSPTGFPLVDQLHKLDYNHSFAILVVQGQSGGDSNVTVQKITRQDDRVVVSANFITPQSGAGQTGNITDAYHLVAVSKDGTWGRQIEFELINNSIIGGGVVARTTHFIP
jgi:hypothetical protein